VTGSARARTNKAAIKRDGALLFYHRPTVQVPAAEPESSNPGGRSNRLNRPHRVDILDGLTPDRPERRVRPGRSPCPAASAYRLIRSFSGVLCMLRKVTTLVVAMFATAAVATGLALADDNSPLHDLMESVNKQSNAIKKATRSKVAYAKADKKELVKQAEELIDLSKKARTIKEAAEKEKKPIAEWEKLADDFIKKSEDFKSVVAKSNATFKDASDSFKKVATTCVDCHKIFRIEDEK
jgi:cytochrome c556